MHIVESQTELICAKSTSDTRYGCLFFFRKDNVRKFLPRTSPATTVVYQTLTERVFLYPNGANWNKTPPNILLDPNQCTLSHSVSWLPVRFVRAQRQQVIHFSPFKIIRGKPMNQSPAVPNQRSTRLSIFLGCSQSFSLIYFYVCPISVEQNR